MKNVDASTERVHGVRAEGGTAMAGPREEAEDGSAPLTVGGETQAWLAENLPHMNISKRRRTIVGARGWTILIGGLGACALFALWAFHEDLVTWKRERHAGRRAVMHHAAPTPVAQLPPPPIATKLAPTRRPARRPHAHRPTAATARRPTTSRVLRLR